MFTFLVKTASCPAVSVTDAGHLIIPGQSHNHDSKEDSDASTPLSLVVSGWLLIICQSIVPKGFEFFVKPLQESGIYPS